MNIERPNNIDNNPVEKEDGIVFQSEHKNTSWAGPDNKVFTYVYKERDQFRVDFSVEDEEKFAKHHNSDYSPDEIPLSDGYLPDAVILADEEEAEKLANLYLEIAEDWPYPSFDDKKNLIQEIKDIEANDIRLKDIN